MARKRFDLSLTTLDDVMLLFHGRYGAGKTHFAGDMLRHERQKGDVKFINIKGEDGYKSLGGMGLGDVAETVDDLNDLREVINELRAKPIRAVALDSAKWVGRLVERHITGSDRAPRLVKGSEVNEWSEVNRALEQTFQSLRGVANIVVVLSPSDKSVDQLTGKVLWTPDLPGRNAVGSAGWFDGVYVIDSEVIGPGRIKRVIKSGLDPDIVIRSRTPRPLPTTIEISEHGGGWAKFYNELAATFEKKEAKGA